MKFLTALTVVLLFALLCWGLAGASQQEAAHNQAQIAECRNLGGFARTNIDGTLESCTFPQGAR